MREAGFGLKAATVTPEGSDDVGSPNRILREEVDGKVIVRTGRRIPGVVGPVSGVYHPISVVRMAVDDAYGAKQWREGSRATTRSPTGREDHARRPAARSPSTRSGRPSGSAPRSTAGRSGRSRRSTRGCSRRRWTRPPRAIPSVEYQPVLIDALYAGLISGAADSPLVIPALNRDGDCLSDLVLPMFGSIAGAESVLLCFDDDYGVEVAMAEAPHGTAPSLMGKNLANPMAMLLACGSVLSYAATKGYAGAERASRAVYESVLEATATGDQDRRPRRARHDVGVHRRRRRAGAHQDRGLVHARHALGDVDRPGHAGMEDADVADRAGLGGREVELGPARACPESNVPSAVAVWAISSLSTNVTVSPTFTSTVCGRERRVGHLDDPGRRRSSAGRRGRRRLACRRSRPRRSRRRARRPRAAGR